MDPKPHAKKLPAGYQLTHSVTGIGKRWEVIEMATGDRVTQNQRSPRLAVELALRALTREP